MNAIKIYTISRPSVDFDAIAEFITDEGVIWMRSPGASVAEEIVEVAGRVCYMSFKETGVRNNTAYIANLIAQGHESVLEHVSWTFLISGVSRAFSHQLVRHRVGFAFSQLSQQYHEESDAEFVMPSIIGDDPELSEKWRTTMEANRSLYRHMVHELTPTKLHQLGNVGAREALRALRSAARSVLPNATATKIVITANARALRHFLKVRGSIPGDEEMRIVAASLLTILQKDAPEIFRDFFTETLPDGSPIVRRLAPSISTPTNSVTIP
ncbi:FAD-dependent thymidylate synthase [Methylomonas methanica]|uniref:Flavin-dependent thymidylate synthase n=1 Tax=Methylomonas methanica (strain DSM 25384 / MC09) TaxID=857087 RepID=F9ZX41_METMM|nr:FAD-dependent thymidylate synthase [Methylomonas methanica]AEF98502.1 Thymidylate synthase thyX [Methylomonas methanica MC09]